MSQPQQQRFDLPSGAVLVVTVAPFQDAWALMKASLKTLKGMDVKPEELLRDTSTLMASPSTFSAVLDRIVEFAVSSDVESAMWRCAQRALYIPAGSPADFPGDKVNPLLLDHPDYGMAAREDYARIVASLLEVNCKPFLAKALSGFLKPQVNPSGSLQSKSA